MKPKFARNTNATPSDVTSEEEDLRSSFHPGRPSETPGFKQVKYPVAKSNANAGEGDDLQPQAKEEFRTYGSKAPVQLLKITEDGMLELCQAGINVLLNIPERIKIASMAGPYRTGKSFALNLLAKRTGQGFKVSEKGDACTQGIWIWGDAIDTGDGKLILLDTEGSRSVNKDPKHDAKIFAFSVLLSSLFMYNTKGFIDEYAIRELSLAAYISDFISYQMDDEDTAEDIQNRLAANAPKFLWVIRDFFLDLESSTPKEYMENVLTMQNYKGRDKETFDKVRDSITSIFKDRNCITLPTPMDEVEDLRRLDEIPEKKYKGEFQKQFAKLREELHQIQMKKLNGIELTGITAASLAMKYIDAINEKGVSNINSTWDQVVKSEYDRMLKEAESMFEEQKNFHVDNLPYEDAEITVNLATAKDNAVSVFKKSTMRNEHLEKLYIEEFELYYDGQLKQILVMNEHASESFNQSLLNNIFDSVFTNLAAGNYTTEIEQLHTDSSKNFEEYLEKAKGPTKLRVMVEFTNKNNPKLFSTLLADMKIQQELEMQKKMAEQGYNEEQIKLMKENMEREKQRALENAAQDDEMKGIDDDLKRLKMQDELNAMINDNNLLKVQISQKQKEAKDMEKKKNEISARPKGKKQGGCKCTIF